ncbi:energy transducer TonB [Salipiger bermudensis]|uniref:energy transducer TonB family protein n=1 Tax=Salipiger bermudensis TaxID=344736 RepID=UPI001CD24A80|nr:energy transducer TonB [Salipiger bermudensis]MCA0960574.1 TonB family protein [Salipiger bermudensis]
MIAHSRTAKLVAILLAGSAHGALALALLPDDPPTLIEGSGGAAEARIGSSFQDMAAGTLSPTPSEDIVKAEPVDEAPQPDTAHETAPVAEAEPIAPEQARPAPPPEPVTETAEAVPVEPDAPAPVAPFTAAPSPDVVAALAPPEPDAAERPEELEPEAIQPQPDATETAEPETAEAVTPEAPEPTQPEETTEALAPEEEPEVEPEDATEEAPETALASSLRPMERPDTLRRPEPEPQPAPRRETRPEPTETRQTQRAPQGNSDRNARAGQAQGSETATATRSGSGGRSQEAGNAAASNYPGQVMRKLSRVPRPRMNARGAAVVAFSITGSGGLSGVSLARSSGSAALDRAALQVVQRAAPFPAPPAGAQRSFSIQIKAR